MDHLRRNAAPFHLSNGAGPDRRPYTAGAVGNGVRDTSRWCDRRIEQVRDRSRVQPFYDQIAQIYHENPVRRVILLTCNVGNASGFLDEVSTDWGVPVAVYIRRVVSRSERAGGRTTVYIWKAMKRATVPMCLRRRPS